MQTGKETTQTHTVSLDSEEHNLSDSQWKTGVRARFPWTGFIALFTVVLCAVSSVVVLLVSDGKSQIHWSKKIAPNVLLSGFNGIANICFGVAIANGVAITWWRKALKGATIQDLHRSWAFSSSIKDIVFYGKYFNFIALAALAAKLTIIDGILLQRATSTVVGDDPGRNITIDAWANTTMPYTGVIGGRSNDVSYLLDWFNSDLSIWSEAGGVAPAWSMYSCEGTCVLDIVGTGFEIDLDIMAIQTQPDMSKMSLEAETYTSTGQYSKAEELYKRMINITQHHEGPESTSRELYNLSAALINQEKYKEAEVTLRDLLVQLTSRLVDDNSDHFLEQEAGAVGLLCRALKGQGKSEEAEMLEKNAANQQKQLQARGNAYGLSQL
ncbi:hypothetical protein JADG_001862 [Aureobasidium aubasidani]|nr:hypothetical protein JADG_001862 [Aureobasidium pullulans]